MGPVFRLKESVWIGIKDLSGSISQIGGRVTATVLDLVPNPKWQQEKSRFLSNPSPSSFSPGGV